MLEKFPSMEELLNKLLK